jgi:hypothetical protein
MKCTYLETRSCHVNKSFIILFINDDDRKFYEIVTGCPVEGGTTLDRRSRALAAATEPRRGAAPGPGPILGPIPGSADDGSLSVGSDANFSSPRKSRRTRARRYHAFGKARVSESLRYV